MRKQTITAYTDDQSTIAPDTQRRSGSGPLIEAQTRGVHTNRRKVAPDGAYTTYTAGHETNSNLYAEE